MVQCEGNHLYLCPVASWESWSANGSFMSRESLTKQTQRQCFQKIINVQHPHFVCKSVRESLKFYFLQMNVIICCR